VNSRYDAIVIGAGPAGATAAYQMAKRGLSVALLEKRMLPRYKACGGVVAPHVEDILDFSIEPAIEYKVTKILVTVRLQSPFITESPSPFAYLVMRDRFDKYLVDAAQRAGVVLCAGSPVRAIAAGKGECVVKTKDMAYRGKYVVGCDGANGATRRLVGAPRLARLAVAMAREIDAPPEATRKWHDTIALDFGQLSSGYAWVFPKARNFSVGAGGARRVAKRLSPYCDQVIAHYRDRMGSDAPSVSVEHCLPVRVRNEPIVYSRTLLAGDAAGLIEPLSGEGIYYAIRSGQIAAETVAEAVERGEGHLMTYERRVDAEIQPELQVAKTLRSLLDLAPSLWVPRLMKTTHPFWRYFHRIFTGERRYQDFPNEFGLIGRVFFRIVQPR